MVLIGTGSEVQLAVEAREILAEKGIRARVVSMPCREWFDEQEASYRETVIPPTVKARVSVEAGIAQGWREIVGDHGRIVSHRALRRLRRLRADLPRVRRHRRGRRRRRRGQHPRRHQLIRRLERSQEEPHDRTTARHLSDAGVSIWLDDLSRERIETGNLTDLVKDRNVVGVTTNPTIFAAALSDGERYDDQVRKLVAEGADVSTGDVRADHRGRPQRVRRAAAGLPGRPRRTAGSRSRSTRSWPTTPKAP